MSTAESILQAVRSWLMLANGLDDDAKVIPANDKGPRPPKPYITVLVTVADIPVGEDETRNVLGHPFTVTGGSAGTVYTLTVNGATVTYTRTAEDTNATAAAGLAAAVVAADEDVFAEASGATLTVSPIVGALSVSETDANLSTGTTVPVELVVGTARASVSVQGYGDGSLAYLEKARRRLRSESVIAQNDEDGVTIRATGGVSNLSALVDTAIESRHLLEVEVDYGFAESGETFVALGTVSVDYEGPRYADESAPPAFSDTLTVEA